MSENSGQLDRLGIQQIIPHREPFLFVDRIIEVEYGKRAVGVLDDVGRPEYGYWLKGHFPGFPVMPGALIIEALAEVGAVAALGLPANQGKIAVLTGIEKCRFRGMASPGKQIRLEATMTRIRSNYGWGHVVASAGDEMLAEADLSFAIIDRPAALGPQVGAGGDASA
ncbi:MAG: 3-hydroxyacyl-ACP dehydratase FabZ [Chloroflexi bacterium]|nr:3-hydroxyacyl-ACP dehydratase FabZ [Chloroflexota bacterium]